VINIDNRRNLNKLATSWPLLLLGSALVISALPAQACSIAIDTRNWDEKIAAAPLVFVGFVSAVVRADGSTDSTPSPACGNDESDPLAFDLCMKTKVGIAAIFTIESPVRGVTGVTFRLSQEYRTGRVHGGMCPPFQRYFTVGERWLFAGSSVFNPSLNLSNVAADKVTAVVAEVTQPIFDRGGNEVTALPRALQTPGLKIEAATAGSSPQRGPPVATPPGAPKKSIDSFGGFR
jgi:hypothetical protein